MLFLNTLTSIYWLKLYWCLFFRVILPLSHRGFRLCSAPIRLLPWTQLGEVWIRADIVALKTMCLTTSPNVDVLYISPTDTSSMQNFILEGLQQKLQNPVLGAIRTLGTWNRAIYCNLQNTCFSLLIDLDTLIIISPKIDAPYLWIRPLGLGPLKFSLQATIDHHGPSIDSGHYTASIICC